MTKKRYVLSWPGTVPRIAPLREGGPGRPVTLLVATAVVIAMALGGRHLIEEQGIDSFGPPLFMLACFGALFLIVWVCVKAIFRSTQVTFVITDRGVEIVPSRQQARLDRVVHWLTHLTFLLTWKGGTWSAWHPITRWSEVRRVEIDIPRKDVVLGGGAWDIRLCCTNENFDEVQRLVRQKAPKKAKLVVRQPRAAELSNER